MIVSSNLIGASGRGGLWETQDVYGDRQAEAAAKRAQRPSVDRPSLSKAGSNLRILRRTSKPTLVRLIDG